MKDQQTTAKQTKAPETSTLKTVLWIGVGILVYISIQWMLPKVGVSS
jgi:hypothetical protein